MDSLQARSRGGGVSQLTNSNGIESDQKGSKCIISVIFFKIFPVTLFHTCGTCGTYITKTHFLTKSNVQNQEYTNLIPKPALWTDEQMN